MPKLKPSNTELKSRVVRAAISSNMELYGLNEDYVAAKTHTTKRTLQNKRKRPETFTLAELWRISEILKFSPEEKAQIL